MKAVKVVLCTVMQESLKGVSPNYSITYLSSYYKTHGKHRSNVTFKLIDQNVRNLDMVKEVLDESPDIVGFSSTSMYVDMIVAAAKGIKQLRPETTIIGGGVHFQIEQDFVSHHPEFDYASIGEGEKMFCEFLDAFIEHDGHIPPDQAKSIKGLSFMHDGALHTSMGINVTADELPYPDLDLMNADYYFKQKIAFGRYGFGRVAIIRTSRGCPFDCSFCFNSRLGRNVRYMPAEKVKTLIMEYVNRYNSKYIAFSDDLFTGDRKRLEIICDFLIESKLGIKWSCLARAEMINGPLRDLIPKMKKAGCVQIGFGFESGCDRVLKLLKGPSASVAQNQQAIDSVHNAGINIMGYFMVGNPTETKAEMDETKAFIEKNKYKFEYWEVFIYTPVPGTMLWKMCEEQGLVDDKLDLSKLRTNSFSETVESAHIFTKTLTARDVVETRVYLKQLLYRTLPVSTKLFWLVYSSRVNPIHTFKRLCDYAKKKMFPQAGV